MPFPARLLNEGEEVVVDVRPHPIALAGPVALVVAVVVVAVVVNTVFVLPVWGSWMLVAAILVALVHLLGRYLRWRSTSLVVTTDRLVRRSGVLSRAGREIPLVQLTDISYRQGLFDRLIGAGDLRLESAGRDSAEILPALPRPAAIQNDIYRLMTARRAGPPGVVAAGLSLPEQIEKLADLFQRGVISRDEFDRTKARLLAGG